MMRLGKTNLLVFIFAAILSLSLLTGCKPNPKDVAEAHERTVLADQRAADLEQAREIRAANDAIDLEIRNARKAEVKKAWSNFIYTMGIVGIAVGGYVLFYAGRATVNTMQGLSNSVVMAAELKALQIHLDEKTRTFPLIMRPIHGNRYLLYDANTGASTVLDVSQPLDRQLAAASGAVKLAGVVAREARQHEHDPAGVSVSANVPIVEVFEQGGQMIVGQDIANLAEVAHG